jgi:hypothetical protein
MILMPSDAAPYPVTITLAIVAWLFTSAFDEILKAPYLVYSVKTATNTKNSSLVDTKITLTNITHDKAYKNVTITLTLDHPDEIDLDFPHGVQPEHPSWEGDTAPTIANVTFQHTFPIIQPDGQFDILFTHHESDAKFIHLTMKFITTKPGDSIPLTDTVLLTTPNFTTLLVENHVLLSVAAMIVVVLLAGVFWLSSPKPTLKLEEPRG